MNDNMFRPFYSSTAIIRSSKVTLRGVSFEIRHTLVACEDKLLTRRIFGQKRKGAEKLHEELHSVHSSRNQLLEGRKLEERNILHRKRKVLTEVLIVNPQEQRKTSICSGLFIDVADTSSGVF